MDTDNSQSHRSAGHPTPEQGGDRRTPRPPERDGRGGRPPVGHPYSAEQEESGERWTARLPERSGLSGGTESEYWGQDHDSKWDEGW
jgi:hypothetical protein